jgi:CBS domain containing-hemolysin-like protein
MAEQLYTIIWIAVSLILIGFFAGYEIAFISANRLSIELKKKQGLRSGIILFYGESRKIYRHLFDWT